MPGSRVLDGFRLAALRDSGLLDMPPQASLERLNRLAAELLGVPVSLVSLVGERRQFFAGQTGLSQPWAAHRETPLSHSFCKHVVARDAPLLIDDARTDPLVADNLAVRDLDVIAYAGVPLRLDGGETLGSFCAIDSRPRCWSGRDLQILTDLAALAADAIELHRARTVDPLCDQLTGLPGRALFETFLARALERVVRREGAVAVVALDLMDFRLINDALGHDAGDTLLLAVADRLRDTLRTEDAVCRSDADHFLVLCDTVDDEADALRVAERLHTAITARPYGLGAEPQLITARVGLAVSTCADAVLDPAELISSATTALADADAAVARTDRSCRARAGSRLRLRNALHGAYRRGEMTLEYQPLVDLRTDRVRGFEALARWHHPQFGNVAPSDFIPVAEGSGEIVALGEWILQRACADLARWRRQHPDADLSVAVNIAPVQLRTATFFDTVATALSDTGVPPDALTLEVTERTLLDDRTAHAQTMHRLRRHGVRIALDDFGTGYSSLAYLTRFPIDLLKIDRSFVAALGDQQNAAALLHGIVTMANGMDLRTVAEGIETETQREQLRDLGCTYGQGYLLGRPSVASEIPGLL
ncbi:bifunctional diguanylate cyclase/phosphodiesterase [Conexibacter sp. CPCC 206217]|uniref:putative bifunctional diguanylate cyclase/phosphodiesterase n=1 Tax=Conexibacter sp. CPCC 206217 TaxID=3064574 RepID=UPI002719BD4C|nr:bifunctional diguanylate cyclase/phosphodiesterase [Conexibacter sp. CPCC 206217]MDO8210194.1 bifunctional diguanylate cyclase/phosphodiesterase [Conexibacter sp. CPCC 206217]